MARLFRQELGCTFTQWRQQVVLAKAVSLAAGRMPVGQIAAELGCSPSAFSAMVRRSMGQPRAGFWEARRRPQAIAPYYGHGCRLTCINARAPARPHNNLMYCVC